MLPSVSPLKLLAGLLDGKSFFSSQESTGLFLLLQNIYRYQDRLFERKVARQIIHRVINPVIPLDTLHLLFTFYLIPQFNLTNKLSFHRERNINFFVAPVERGTQFITPPVERTVKRIEAKLPLEKAALGVDRRIKKGMDRAGWSSSVVKKD